MALGGPYARAIRLAAAMHTPLPRWVISLGGDRGRGPDAAQAYPAIDAHDGARPEAAHQQSLADHEEDVGGVGYGAGKISDAAAVAKAERRFKQLTGAGSGRDASYLAPHEETMRWRDEIYRPEIRAWPSLSSRST